MQNKAAKEKQRNKKDMRQKTKTKVVNINSTT